MTSPIDAFEGLEHFHPLIAAWFRQRIGQPTAVQLQAWSRIVTGEHVLVSAPTGSGKTFTAFLWALNQLITGAWSVGAVRVLYISPLKALNNDIWRNLTSPLNELQRCFKQANAPFPEIRVFTRSGDTPQDARRQMLRRPPEILITTPESLNLFLASKSGRSILTELKTVILDEIHAVAGSKRGVHLITAVDRLVLISGEFQRLALSATVRPLETVAAFVGGYRLFGGESDSQYEARSVAIIEAAKAKKYEISVRFPERAEERAPFEKIWHPIVRDLKEIVHRNRSTLIFVNSRALCEKLTMMINADEPQPLSYSHHGALSREIRFEIEQKLKNGELRAIVATNSLELGIDIGSLDEVVMVQSPPTITSAIQRLGRAGHGVGETSRGVIYPSHAEDFVEAAVVAAGILKGDIETLEPVLEPLDVLAQVLVSMVGAGPWNLDDLYAEVRTSFPYRQLTRRRFDLVLAMLAGRYALSRIRELKPRFIVDQLDNTVTLRKGGLLDLFISGGTIPDRGYYHLRHSETNALIGELDEEFVWEASLGQSFTLGTQKWRIQQITHNDVMVTSAPAEVTATPFWKAEERSRDSHFSSRIGSLLELADQALDDPELAKHLQQHHAMNEVAAAALIGFLQSQRRATDVSLPHRHHLVVETVESGPASVPGNQVIIHTFWGGRLNRPLALALEAAWEARFQQRLEVYAGNDAIVVLLPHAVGAAELLSLVTSNSAEPLLRKRLESSGTFGARFRECAGRALLLPRRKFNERLPLWMNRLRAKKLLDAVRRFEDFPILLEAWRTCLHEEFDLVGLQDKLLELETGSIIVSEIRTAQPSPMAKSMSWRQINRYMYEDDEQPMARSQLRDELIREVSLSASLRPAIAREVVAEFELKRQRLSPGYAPQSPEELLDWVRERWLLPAGEWRRLLAAVERDGDGREDATGEDAGSEDAAGEGEVGSEAALVRLAGKIVVLQPPGASSPLYAARERLPELVAMHLTMAAEAPAVEEVFGEEASGEETASDEHGEVIFTTLVAEWLSFFGPVPLEFIASSLGIPAHRLLPVLDELIDAQRLIRGQLVSDEPAEMVCDTSNFEMLLRLSRKRMAPSFEPLDSAVLPLFIAHFQGLAKPQDGAEGLRNSLSQLTLYPAPAELWETELLPARVRNYDPAWLDSLLQEGELRWRGCGSRQLLFCLAGDEDLLDPLPVDANAANPNAESAAGLPVPATAAGAGLDASKNYITTKPMSPSAEEPIWGSLRALFPNPHANYTYAALLQQSRLAPAQLATILWNGIWAGGLALDSFSAVRRGNENDFAVPEFEVKSGSRRRVSFTSRRGEFARYRSAWPSGNWSLLPQPAHGEWSDEEGHLRSPGGAIQAKPDEDYIGQEERAKERARMVLERYGVVCRELLVHELPELSWRRLFRSLRLMELSGEVLAGYFFHHLSGPQFVSHQAFRMLQNRLPEDAVYWLNAADPASLCGLDCEPLKAALPKRVASTHLVYRGAELAVISRAHAKQLTFLVPPDDPRFAEYLGFLHHLQTRSLQPKRSLTIASINDLPASQSLYLQPLRAVFDVSIDVNNVVLYRKW